MTAGFYFLFEIYEAGCNPRQNYPVVLPFAIGIASRDQDPHGPPSLPGFSL